MLSMFTSSTCFTTMTCEPAALAAVIPTSLSSTTSISLVATPAWVAARMYISGCGLACVTSSLLIMKSR